MIQSVNPAPTDETDGLPMPRRIWAVISVGFALCMSVLDVNIINIVLPTLSHDFGTSPAVTTWIIIRGEKRSVSICGRSENE